MLEGHNVPEGLGRLAQLEERLVVGGHTEAASLIGHGAVLAAGLAVGPVGGYAVSSAGQPR